LIRGKREVLFNFIFFSFIYHVALPARAHFVLMEIMFLEWIKHDYSLEKEFVFCAKL